MDIYAEVTSRIIAEMEKGVIPWKKPWIASGKCVSHATGKPYSLLNQMLLGRPGEYVTFNQCQQDGGRIRKGAKSQMVVFWKWIEQEDEETGEKKEVPFLRYFNVFHIQSSKFLSENRSRELIQKMETLCSRHETQLLNHEVVLANRVKSTNRQIYINIDHLHSAISHNSMITFRYFAYDMNKDKAYMKKGENYTASPWKMVYVDENYYLLAFESGRFKHFRVDKMENVTELNMPREGGDTSGNLDMSDYNKYIFGMYGGEVVPVTMVFLFKMMGAVMDKFGHDIMIMKEDEKHFRITVPVAVSQQFFGWIFGLGKMARIVAPESVKQKMKTMLSEIAQKYEDE